MVNATVIAKVCHEVNKAYCESLGDNSQPSWEDAPDWQRLSAVDGVTHRLTNPESTPEDSHINWLKLKEAEGWKKGPVKDAEKKEHPCFTAYANLPVEQQAKDHLFVAVVDSLKELI